MFHFAHRVLDDSDFPRSSGGILSVIECDSIDFEDINWLASEYSFPFALLLLFQSRAEGGGETIPARCRVSGGRRNHQKKIFPPLRERKSQQTSQRSRKIGNENAIKSSSLWNLLDAIRVFTFILSRWFLDEIPIAFPLSLPIKLNDAAGKKAAFARRFKSRWTHDQFVLLSLTSTRNSNYARKNVFALFVDSRGRNNHRSQPNV